MKASSQIVATVGGATGHWLRRCIHIGMLIIPFLYYAYAKPAADFIHITPQWLVIIIAGIVILLDLIRLLFGITLFGQRPHEAKQFSSFAWGAIAIALVLLLAPGKAYAVPIIAGCSLGDPLIGELRRKNVSAMTVALLGMFLIALIWLTSSLSLGSDWWFILIMPPITVAAEWPSLKWIDDNALMQIVPLLVVLLLM